MIPSNITIGTLFHDDLHFYVQHTYAFYHTPRSSILTGVSDQHLSLALPVVVYWVYSLFFCCLDSLDSDWLRRHRVHESAEVLARNLASVPQVVRAVILQQVIQTVLGLLILDNETDEVHAALVDVETLRQWTILAAKHLLGKDLAQHWVNVYGRDAVWLLFWWGVPCAQFLFALYVPRSQLAPFRY